MDLLLPLPVRISKITPSIIGNTALARSIFSGASRTLGRSGDRYGFDVTVSQASDKESFPMRGALRNIRAGMRSQANRLWLADPSYQLRGSFPTGELLLNGTFSQGAAGWGTFAAAISVADGYARVQNTTTAAGYITNAAAVALVSGVSYVVRVLTYPGSVVGWAINGGTTSGGSGYFASGTLTTQQLFVQPVTASTVNFFLGLQNATANVGDFAHFLYASLSRCSLVNGASQTGPNLNINALPASAAGLLLPGDRVQIGTQLNTVVAPLNSNASGQGYLQCALPWRISPASGAPVIIDKPMARCILTSNTGSWDESPGGFADFELVLEESLDL